MCQQCKFKSSSVPAVGLAQLRGTVFSASLQVSFIGRSSSEVNICSGHNVLFSFPASCLEGMHVLFDFRNTSTLLCFSVLEKRCILSKNCTVILAMLGSDSPHIIVVFFPLPSSIHWLEDLHLKFLRNALNIISIFVLQRPSPRRSNSPDKFKRPTPPPSPNTQTPVQPPPPPPPPPVQPTVQSAASQSATFQHSVHPSSQP